MRKTHAVASGAVALLLAGSAWAGLKQTWSVGVDTSYREAYGQFGSARNSADSTQYISCAVANYPTGSNIVFCNARNAAGTSGSCSSTAAELVNAARSITADSYLYFTWDATNTCNYIYVANGSHYAPKQP